MENDNLKKSVIRKRKFKASNKDKKEIKILSFCDNHGDLSIISNIRKKIKEENINLVICCGDFTYMTKNLERILVAMNNFSVPVMIIHGNHETSEIIMEFLHHNYLKNIIFIHKNLIQFKNMCITGYGGEGFTQETPDLDNYTKTLKRDIKKINYKFKIFVSHAPPHNTKLDYLYGHYRGNYSIKKTLEELNVDLALCGHIHENEYKKDKIKNTIVINPGLNGTIITIDDNFKITKIKYLNSIKNKANE